MAPSWARSVRWSAAGACLLAGSIWAGSDPAGAVDWQLLYRLTETLRVSDNIELRSKPEGAAASSQTGAGLDIAARTPRAEWRTTGNVGHLVFFGRGAPEDRERTTMSARSNLLKRTRGTNYNLNAYFRQAPVTGTVLVDPVLTDPVLTDPVLTDPVLTDPVLDPVFEDIDIELLRFDRISYGASGGLVHRWTRADDLALSVRADRVDFTEEAPNVTPHTVLEMSGNWTRRLTRRVDGRARASVRHFRSENDTDLRRLIYNVALGANVRATPRLTVDANAGAAITDQRRSGAAVGTSQSDVSVGFVGDFRLSYTPWRDTTMTFAVSQRVSPDVLGDLRTAQAATGAATYRINEWSRINVTGAFTTSTATGDGAASRRAWTVSPSYTHALTRHWDLSLSYRWIKTDATQSNSGFLTLSHRGTILP